MTNTLSLLVLAAAASAPAGTPPLSPRCERALEALRVHEAQLPASGAAGSAAALAKAAALRRNAARECLGGPGAVPPPQMHREPLRVPPVAAPASAAAVRPARPAPPRRPRRPPRRRRCSSATAMPAAAGPATAPT
ncbi:MAG: hypothetical protein KIT35_23415 [Piscinibacter sp.]|uniref:hypothetical protein n=1 Tax=Piscinibacter sp. TaxID=1903157 RepID=UPI002587FEED|nr:hypothetical protein [Piscinibacter sp.]MCW5666793.1 hypothetical protein [Piscinibacter sp.]